MRFPAENEQSKELISMESELRFLLSHSSLTMEQRREFLKLLELVFDLFQIPIFNGYKEVSLIDLSNIELFNKIQELINSLTMLIIEEEKASPRRKSSDLLRSPTSSRRSPSPVLKLTSPKLRSPSFTSNNLPEFKDHRRSLNVENINRLNDKFQMLNTPIPRTFSTHSIRSSVSPTSYRSPISPVSYREVSREGSSKKRYSMRF